jgi:hypothetical protein
MLNRNILKTVNDFGRMLDLAKRAETKMDKAKVISTFSEDEEIKKCLDIIRNPKNKFWIKIDTIVRARVDYKGKIQDHPFYEYVKNHTLFDFLSKLKNKEFSGKNLTEYCMVWTTIHANAQQHIYTIYRIISREFNIGISLVEESFKVQRGKLLETKHLKAIWSRLSTIYVSRKLDGLRCIAIVENGKCTLYTKVGNEISSVPYINKDFEFFCRKNSIDNVVFDAELCRFTKDGIEDFKSISSASVVKEKIIENAEAHIFDYISLDEFKDPFTPIEKSSFFNRYENIRKMFLFFYGSDFKLRLVAQKKIEAVKGESFEEYLSKINELYEDAVTLKGWEGLILRTNSFYQNVKNANILKMKKCNEDEFEVIEVESTIMGGEKVIGALKVVHKDKKKRKEYSIISVGSGLTKEDRINFLNNPKDIIGKTITVEYMEETKNEKTGLKSIRHPRYKGIRYD